MAITKCPECGNDVSTTAKSCPHCGAKVKKPMSTKIMAGLIVIVIVLCLVIASTTKKISTSGTTIAANQISPIPDNQTTPTNTNEQTPTNKQEVLDQCGIVNGYEFGMTINKFKDTYPKSLSEPFCHNIVWGAGEEVVCDGQMVMNSIPVDVSFYFPKSPGITQGKLFSITGNFIPTNFQTIKSYLIGKFGNPDTDIKTCDELSQEPNMGQFTEQDKNNFKLSGGCEMMNWNYRKSISIMISQFQGGALGPDNSKRLSFFPSSKNSSACFINMPAATAQQRAEKAVEDYAKLKEVTVQQLENRIGMSHDDLIAEVSGKNNPDEVISLLEQNGEGVSNDPDRETTIGSKGITQLTEKEFNNQFRCPESYREETKKNLAMDDMLKWYGAHHKNATIRNIVTFRMKILEEHNCNVTLQNIQNNSFVSSDSKEASFDCTKAKSAAEILICNDPELSNLDTELAKIYRQAKSKTNDTEAFKKQTIDAWKWRESNCHDKECLLAWYADRKSVLQNY